ncbi:MAG: glutamine synthetase [Bacteroidetes bacterium]|jgi:glutamine synthetase|nr:glutamine synthetase [Bacteroidota bacterium]MBT3749609.1 glutamine synthetase [Bacteroidota bacterium]MBT4401693.1 glutamine synthetase [Bacteroidota bacterium]MBT4411435.1 glutamine synthetase [Bacteroidota bacterium]MBT7093562.1 glutamine synthetase [Bacteroidota bacterium]
MDKYQGIISANLLEQFLDKPCNSFTRTDLIRFIEEKGIRMLNFRYVAEDGKLKTLNFVINGRDHLESVLATGERVDGSSLFSFIGAGSSDLYVVPRYKTAFVNPFSEVPTLDMLCSYYDSEGKPLESSPEYILRKAHKRFKSSSGFVFKAMGELEYYVQGVKEEMYPTEDQRGYHASSPFSNYESLRLEAMKLISRAGGKIKYGHCEVGSFSTDAESFEQHEIEFLPVDAEDAVDQLIIAKWILRQLGDKYGVNLSFAPKITVGKAGSGLHVHMMLTKDGKNEMMSEKGLSDIAKKLIAGLLDLASPLTAFGNTLPTSYLRLVPHQEAPTNICWGDRNRSVLVRVPLGWQAVSGMIKDANPLSEENSQNFDSKQTVEIRSPDGSADLYHLFAGLIMAAQHGLEMENALEMANQLYVDVNIFQDKHKDRLAQLANLPECCEDSAKALQQRRDIFEKDGVFPTGTIDNIIGTLNAFQDKGLSEKLYGKTEEIRKLVYKYLHHM